MFDFEKAINWEAVNKNIDVISEILKKNAATPKKYYGCEDVFFIWNGEWSDPYVFYNGKLYDEIEVSDWAWSDYNCLCEEDSVKPTDEGFEEYMSSDVVYNILTDLQPLDMSPEEVKTVLNEKCLWNLADTIKEEIQNG